MTDEADKYQLYQWLFFQMSGQGYVTYLLTSFASLSSHYPSPYFGQGFWFNHIHPEKIASAQDRYKNEAKRVLGVLESVLLTREWLVGGKFTIADLSFVPCVLFFDMRVFPY